MAGFLGSTASFTVFEARAPKTLDYDRLRQRAFTPAVDSNGVRSGWVGIGNALDVYLAVGIDHGPFAVFSLREDTRKVPGAALRLQLAEALQEEQAKRGGRVSRERKQELKEEVHLKLLANAAWVPALTDCLWDLGAGLLLLAASGKKAETVLERFKETFGIAPDALTPADSLTPLFARLVREDVDCGGWTLRYAGVASLAQADAEAAVSVANTASALESALGEGLSIQRLRLTASRGEQELTFSLDTALAVSSPKLPKAEKGAATDDDASILLKADALSECARLVKALALA